ncbi:hypothetical protein CR513_23684, partial [Mucuna pruriens]
MTRSEVESLAEGRKWVRNPHACWLTMVCYGKKEQANVLRMLGIAPSQLHPTGWAAIQAFKVVCLALGILPSTLVFLSHYTT